MTFNVLVKALQKHSFINITHTPQRISCMNLVDLFNIGSEAMKSPILLLQKCGYNRER